MTIQQGGSQIFHAEVRDIQDPDESGKVKIIVHGHHNIGDTQVKEEELPWAHCMHNNEPSLNKIGSSTKYLPGSTVIGIWLDPETKQIPIILGSFHRAGVTKGK